ncbi:uncharacterized protein J3D65DRAFT_627073 [Phyllosticta citribraziliensis]|uniref:Secreted protein n=1 Tax=Phyllosticta citribraziliensis TaxID=989973 RepID=A0ABR1LLD3_9PEZI
MVFRARTVVSFTALRCVVACLLRPPFVTSTSHNHHQHPMTQNTARRPISHVVHRSNRTRPLRSTLGRRGPSLIGPTGRQRRRADCLLRTILAGRGELGAGIFVCLLYFCFLFSSFCFSCFVGWFQVCGLGAAMCGRLLPGSALGVIFSSGACCGRSSRER